MWTGKPCCRKCDTHVHTPLVGICRDNYLATVLHILLAQHLDYAVKLVQSSNSGVDQLPPNSWSIREDTAQDWLLQLHSLLHSALDDFSRGIPLSAVAMDGEDSGQPSHTAPWQKAVSPKSPTFMHKAESLPDTTVKQLTLFWPSSWHLHWAS